MDQTPSLSRRWAKKRSKLRLASIPLIALALAACSAQPASEPMPVEPDGGIGDGAGPVPGAEEAEPFRSGEIIDPDILKGEIPARYHGVWDYVKGSCSPESDMRMEVTARRITFYESIGDVAGMGQDGEDAIADLVMQGEGETWTQSTRLALVQVDGQTQLHVSDATKAKAIDEYPRKLCPQ